MYALLHNSSWSQAATLCGGSIRLPERSSCEVVLTSAAKGAAVSEMAARRLHNGNPWRPWRDYRPTCDQNGGSPRGRMYHRVRRPLTPCDLEMKMFACKKENTLVITRCATQKRSEAGL